MNELFGVSMTMIALICVIATAAILGLIGLIAVRNPVMFKMGLRNIPRRPAQTALIVIGLMLSTLIMSAAFGTGDTLTSSITAEVYNVLGEVDEIVEYDLDAEARPADQQVIALSDVEAWRQEFANDPDIETLVPFLAERLPVQNTRTRLNESSARLVGYQSPEGLGGLKDTAGRAVALSGAETAVNRELADKIQAQAGDTILVFYEGRAVELTVKAIVPDSVLSGAFDTFQKQGAAVDFAFLAQLTGKAGNADGVFVSNTGNTRTGTDRTDAATARLEAAIGEKPYRVAEVKQDGVETAELFGNAFTTIFVVFGLFSIAAGVLLIFLIFIMLAAERKPEMGMARAVGAKRRQLVESFLAEGMGYDLGSAVVGLAAGMAVTFAMVAIIKAFAGDNLGLDLTVTFTVRSLTVAFCLGIISTFLVIFASSWRASRLNIVTAIRDLPDSRPINDEDATWAGYRRAVLNGVVAMGLPLGLSLFFFGPIGLLLGTPLVLVGVISPWVYFLRGSSFAAPRAVRTGEAPAKWPWIVGLCLPIAGWLFMVLPYLIALLLVKLTRDRRPASIPTWVVVAGIVAPPFGFILVLLQSVRARISWSAGIGAALGFAGVALVQGGLDLASSFYYAFGVSLIFLFIALTLRYFKIHERLSFTVTSGLLLIYWYLEAPGKLNWLHRELSGDIEMFFLSGMVMVTAGVFIVVYNADIVLPIIARVGSRYGRIVPALKTGVAYPLTSRFRTGMTMVMIGLIMFALVMNSTINRNFSEVFLSDDTRGGFDVLLLVNENNPIDDLTQALAEGEPGSLGAPDPAKVQGIGEVRIAFPWETEVQNIDRIETNDEVVRNGVAVEEKVVKPFLRYGIYGADDEFFATTRIPMKFRGKGYATDEAVWAALAADPTLAVINAAVTIPPNPFGPPLGDDTLRLEPIEEGFEPFTLDIRDPASGRTSTIRVIAQMKDSADTFFVLGTGMATGGIVTSREVVTSTFPDAKAQRFYLTLTPGTDARLYAQQIESTLVQATSESLQELLDEQQALSNGFLLVFQGFMGLGLIVGIAALSVVASRAVVERRQQIGMLRAIGYQRSMVALSFLFESGFIALSGIVLGLGLGLSLAWVLFTSGEFGEETRNSTFVVPWLEVGIVSGIAFAASMLMTFLPARAASRVPVAEALRYE